MSYCVNCGVELEKGCGECPLCDTPVINPREHYAEQPKPAYPEKIEIPKSINKRYWGFVFTLVLLIPNIVLSVLNLVVLDSSTMKYVVAGFGVAWLWFIFPLLWKKPIPVLLIGIDALSLLAYLNMFKTYGAEAGWFSSLVLPVVIVLWAICNILVFWLRKPRNKPLIAIAVLGAISVMSFVVEICMSMLYLNKFQITVSVILTACCIALMVLFAVMEKSKRFKAWASRKFFM